MDEIIIISIIGVLLVLYFTMISKKEPCKCLKCRGYKIGDIPLSINNKTLFCPRCATPFRYNGIKCDNCLYINKNINQTMKKQYKLIKEYPGSPKLNSLFDYWTDNISEQVYNVIYGFIPLLTVKKYPEFWQEIKPKEWEITAFKNNVDGLTILRKEGYYLANNYKGSDKGADLSWCLMMCTEPRDVDKYSIYSVKRLSDGEIFTVGDKIDCKGWFGNIIKFEIINNELKIFQQQHINSSKYKPLLIQDLIKVKQPLFKTEDGKEIYEGDNTFGIDEKYQFLKFNGWVWKKNESPNKLHKHFSTKEKAEEYIINNKPCLSLKEVEEIASKASNRAKLAVALTQLIKGKLKL